MPAFHVQFSAFNMKTRKPVKLTATIVARDSYEATDRMIKKIGQQYQDLINMVFRFNRSRKLSTSSISAQVARAAGPEEA